MKYFKIANTKDEDVWDFYVSSTLENDTPENIARILHLDTGDQYEITEVTKEEFDHETEEDDEEGLLLGRRDMDLPDDDWEDEEDEYVD